MRPVEKRCAEWIQEIENAKTLNDVFEVERRALKRRRALEDELVKLELCPDTRAKRVELGDEITMLKYNIRTKAEIRRTKL